MLPAEAPKRKLGERDAPDTYAMFAKTNRLCVAGEALGCVVGACDHT